MTLPAMHASIPSFRQLAHGGIAVSAIVLAALALGARAQLAGARFDASPYPAIVAQIREGGPYDRQDFARMALEEMASVYEEEVTRAAQKPPRRAEDWGGYRRWMDTSARQATEYRVLAASISDASVINVVLDGPGTVRLIIDGRNVILAGPRIDGPDVLEARIVERACLYWVCSLPVLSGAQGADGYTDGAETETPTWRAGGSWSFAQNRGPEYVTANGLHFRFADMQALQKKEAASRALASDLTTVAEVAGYLAQQGWPIEWDFLRLGPASGGQHTLLLNAFGDSVSIDVHDARRLADALPPARDWLRAVATGGTATHHLTGADTLTEAQPPEPAEPGYIGDQGIPSGF